MKMEAADEKPREKNKTKTNPHLIYILQMLHD